MNTQQEIEFLKDKMLVGMLNPTDTKKYKLPVEKRLTEEGYTGNLTDNDGNEYIVIGGKITRLK